MSTLDGMTNFFDSPRDLYRYSITGQLYENPSLRWDDEGFVITTALPETVVCISGGGAGHEPLHSGFIGEGMLTAVCPGHIFTSPNAQQFYHAAVAADQGRGVLFIIKNYTGDVLNAKVATTMLQADGIDSETVYVDDDVATDSADGPGRRGTAATILVEKICGAAAAEGRSLSEVAQLGREVARRSRSMAVSLDGVQTPQNDKSFTLTAQQLEFGVGIHGEAGRQRRDRGSIEEIVDALLQEVLGSLELVSKDGQGAADDDAASADGGDGSESDSLGALDSQEKLVLIVNNLGGCANLGISGIAALALRRLAQRELPAEFLLTGSFVTAWNMPGFSLTVSRLTPELLELLQVPTTAPAWKKPQSVVLRSDAISLKEVEFAEGEVDANGFIARWISRVLEQVPEITELDRKAGDGDFGANMQRALEPLVGQVPAELSEAYELLGRAFMVLAGGTSGAIFGLFFHTLGERLKAVDSSVSDAFDQALTAIKELGGAQVGDRTVIDAIEPAVEALKADNDWSEVASAAADGAAETASMAAAKGRASYMGDNAADVVDPGALVMSWFFEELAESR